MNNAPLVNTPPSSEPPVTPPPIPPSVSPHPKALWFVAGITILALGILVGFLGTKVLPPPSQKNTPDFSSLAPTHLPAETLVKEGDPTANWKTYENKEHGYVVKYPSNYKLFFDGKTPIIMKPGGEREGTDAFSFYQIVFTPLDTSKELQDLVAENINTSKQIWGVDSPEVKNMSPIYEVRVGNLNGLSFDLACVGYCHNIFIKKDTTKSFQITVRNANQEVKNMYQSEVDQILSTFKFTTQDNEDILKKIIDATKPMVWSEPKVTQSEFDLNGEEYGTGVRIASPSLDKSQNKASPLTSSDNPFFAQEGWKYKNGADGAGVNYEIYEKTYASGRRILIIAQAEEHSVFLSNMLAK